MPITMTADEPARCLSVLMPTAATEAAWSPVRVSPSHAAPTRTTPSSIGHGRLNSSTMATMTASSIKQLIRNLMSIPLAPGQGIHDIQPHRSPGRQCTDDHSDRQHQRDAQRPGAEAHARQIDEVIAPFGNHRCQYADQAHAYQPAQQHQQDRLSQHHPEYASVGEANGFQHRELRGSFAYRLHHGVASQQQQREEYRAHD